MSEPGTTRLRGPRDKRRGRGLGKAEQGAETRARLLAVARQAFGELGYAATTTEHLLAEAEVTRGAFYHHFEDKADLMRAVCHAVYGEVTRAVEARAAACRDPWSALVAGCDEFLTVVASAATVRVLFLDGPVVLGFDEWDAMERQHGFRSLVEGIAEAMRSGAMARLPVEPLAVLLNGALNGAVYWASRQPDPAAAAMTIRRAFRVLLERQRTGGAASRPPRKRTAARRTPQPA